MTVYSFRDSNPMVREFPTEPIQFYPDAKVIEVYGSSENDFAYRGMVKVNYMGYIGYTVTESSSEQEIVVSEYQGQFEVDAYVMLPYGFKPTTDLSQSSTSKIKHPLNQQYGMIAPPRIGDRVMVGHFGGGKWVVMGTFPAHGGNEQPPHDNCDLSFIHRSGSSIRFNDGYPSTQTGLPTGNFDGVTGHMTLVGNRVMFLSGSKFLPHGLLSDFEVHGLKLDTGDESDGYVYPNIFDNELEPSSSSDPYYDNWDSDLGTKKFLRPPNLSEGYAVVHDGGGLIRIEKGTDNHSNMRLGARGVTIYAGKKYWNAGLYGDTTHVSPAPDSTMEDDVIKIIHHTGAYIKIDADGAISIVTADGQDYVITATGAAGEIVLGSKGVKVVGDGDTTTIHVVVNAFGASTYEAPTGHSHTVNASQDEVWIP